MILGLLLQVIVRDLNSFWMITIAILFQELFSPTLDIDLSKLLDLLSVDLCRHSYTHGIIFCLQNNTQKT